MTQDLRSFLTACGDQVVHVTEPVSPDREPAALIQRLETEGRFPVLWFERVGSSNIPVVTNVHATPARLALALGVPVEELETAYQERLSQPITPVLVKSGPVQEVVTRDVDLRAWPIITPSDNCVAPYIGGGVLVARDPETGIPNLSFNRLMLVGRNRFTFHAAPGLHLHRLIANAEARKTDLPAAIILGHHPAFALGTLAKVPFGVDEYTCAGGMLQSPVELVTGVSQPIDVPTHAEIVLEGRVLHGVRESEGPYDEFTGYAMPADLQTVFEVTAITHRRGPIFQDIFGGTTEHILLGALPKQATLRARLRMEISPQVQDVYYPPSGCGRLHAAIAIRGGDARQVLATAFDMDHFLKHIWVVDDDVNVRDDAAVAWAMATRFQGATDLLVLRDQLGSSLDPSAAPGGRGAKLGFDCTRKKSFPPRRGIDPRIQERTKTLCV